MFKHLAIEHQDLSKHMHPVALINLIDQVQMDDTWQVVYPHVSMYIPKSIDCCTMFNYIIYDCIASLLHIN